MYSKDHIHKSVNLIYVIKHQQCKEKPELTSLTVFLEVLWNMCEFRVHVFQILWDNPAKRKTGQSKQEKGTTIFLIVSYEGVMQKVLIWTKSIFMPFIKNYVILETGFLLSTILAEILRILICDRLFSLEWRITFHSMCC